MLSDKDLEDSGDPYDLYILLGIMLAFLITIAVWILRTK